MSASELGRKFAEAFAAKDKGRLTDVLAPEVDFRGLTPNSTWEASTAEDLVTTFVGRWLEEGDEIDELEHVESGAAIGSREHVGYRLRGHNDKGPFTVEQQVYYEASDGQVTWLRILCSGFQYDR